MRVFLAGIIQGSYQGLELHDQSYRDRLKDIFRTYVPDAETCCPIEMHPSGVGYAPEQQRQAFFELVETASQADLVVAYLPQASLGTAIEMWEAYHHGRPVVVITPMRENWVINLLAQAVFPTLDAFEAFVREGGLRELSSDLPPQAEDGRRIPRRTRNGNGSSAGQAVSPVPLTEGGRGVG
jgi:nucleoside 2-deoxyribosyltransferase